MISTMFRTLAIATLVSLGAAACTTSQERPEASPLPAAKTTCNELVLTSGSSTLELVDRVLVPYSRTILGVEAEYEDDHGRSLMLISGGYLDDITEPYDNLQPAGTMQLGSGTADLLEGSFFGTPIAVAYRLGTDPPCSTLAAVAIGFSTEAFTELALEIELRKHESG